MDPELPGTRLLRLISATWRADSSGAFSRGPNVHL
eukprot:CAMPEP_0184301446 /NCGR_PEP_ID=MMETSP1049-20130417/11647_1 /TAXON_ID=77928 /ORGANISM="Proteomonas sulcata, Strain CCMP704" /LENGTH=34 /DNA_ID= /DNA_START= /DNA_END= /DNA_ORIENTATION=